MELSNKQQSLVNQSLNQNTLIEGYSGVGKSTVLIKRYEKLCQDYDLNRNDICYIVCSELKKKLLINQYKKLASKYTMFHVMTLNELIFKYLNRLNLPLFENTIDHDRKRELVKNVILNHPDHLTYDYSIDFILDEINFIQQNICIKDYEGLDKTLQNELKIYLLSPRKSVVKGLLSFKEKQYFWDIYTQYVTKALHEDFFDEQTFYQSFLRLLYHHYDNHELTYTFNFILVDDIEDFSKVQLDIIYHLYDSTNDKHHFMISLDDLKSKDKNKNFKKSLLYKNINKVVALDVNYRNSKNVYEIIKSNLKNNDLMKVKCDYFTQIEKEDLKSVLTFFYNKSINEKKDVFFDRLELLQNRMNYKLSDILVIFYDRENYKEMIEECYNYNIKTISIFEHIEYPELDGLVFMHKDDLINCQYKVVILYDADNKKLCNGPVNTVTNLSNNFLDSIIFYISISTAEDFLIVNTSISEPSHLLLPSNIDYDHFVFELSSMFNIKSTLNVYRISDFTAWIKDNLMKHYQYKEDMFGSHPIFELTANLNEEKIGIKILDNNIDYQVIEQILNIGEDFSYIVIFDNHHYLTFKNENSEFHRVEDIPKNL